MILLNLIRSNDFTLLPSECAASAEAALKSGSENPLSGYSTEEKEQIRQMYMKLPEGEKLREVYDYGNQGQNDEFKIIIIKELIFQEFIAPVSRKTALWGEFSKRIFSELILHFSEVHELRGILIQHVISIIKPNI